MSKRKKISIIDKLIQTGVERNYTPEEIDAMMEEKFGDAFKEHERLKKAGLLDSTPTKEELENAKWDESMIEEDPAPDGEDL